MYIFFFLNTEMYLIDHINKESANLNRKSYQNQIMNEI